MTRNITLWILVFASSVLVFSGEAPLREVDYLNEGFEGPDFPPAGWFSYTSHPNEYYYWDQNNSNHAGGTAPEAWVEVAHWAPEMDYMIVLYTPELDTSDATSLFLRFKHSIALDCSAAAEHDFYVWVTADGSNWTDVTPWINPPYNNIGPETVTINITDFISSSTTVAFWIWIPYYADYIQYWAVDDVRIFELYLDSYRKLRVYRGTGQ